MGNKILLISCFVMKQEIEQIMTKYGLNYDVHYLPQNSHQNPDQMREYLDQKISELTDIDYVVLPMGRCGNSIIGVHSYQCSLVLPKCEDCVDLMLSDKRLFEQKRPERTYFFTDGWLQLERSFVKEYTYTVKNFGQKLGSELIGMIYANYRNFAYIDTGTGAFQKASEEVLPLTKATGTGLLCLEGRCGTLVKMLRGQFEDEDLMVIPPGMEITNSLWDDKSV